MQVSISEIRIGNRVRSNLGDIAALAKSIGDVGLLQPVAIRADKTLVAGQRRILACKELGWKEIPAHVCKSVDDEIKAMIGERDENTCRKDFTPSEAVAVGNMLLEFETAAAKEQQKKSPGRPKKGTGNSRTFNCFCGESFDTEVWHCSCGHHWQLSVLVCKNCLLHREDSRMTEHFKGSRADRAARAATATDRVAAAVGMDRKTLAKASAIVKAAESHPERFNDVKSKMDETGKVDAAFKQLKAKQKEDRDDAAAKEATEKLERAADANDQGVKQASFVEVAKSLPDSSVSLIFTDPPYDADSLPMFNQMAIVAKRVLVDGGSLLTFCGMRHLPTVIESLGGYLDWFWPVCCLHTGADLQMRELGIKNKWKTILWFTKGSNRRDPNTFVADLVVSRQEKDLHAWQQSEIEAAHFIESLTRKDEIVFDPFCGSGTTAAVAKKLGRKWLTCDLDPRAVVTARERLSKIA